MIKYELKQLLYNKKRILVILAFISIICIDALLVFRGSFLYEYMKNPYYDINVVYQHTYTPANAAFLSGSSHGHIPQEIILWLLPFYFLYLNADLYTKEVKMNYYQLLQIRNSKDNILLKRIIVSFIIGFIIMFIGLFLNYGICLIIFKDGLKQNISANDLVWFLSSSYPNIAYICYMLIVSMIVGVYSSVMTCLAYILNRKVPLYIASFILWYVQINSQYSLMYVTQPFIEYGSQYILIALGFFVFSSIAIIIIAFIKGKYYDHI